MLQSSQNQNMSTELIFIAAKNKPIHEHDIDNESSNREQTRNPQSQKDRNKSLTNGCNSSIQAQNYQKQNKTKHQEIYNLRTPPPSFLQPFPLSKSDSIIKTSLAPPLHPHHKLTPHLTTLQTNIQQWTSGHTFRLWCQHTGCGVGSCDCLLRLKVVVVGGGGCFTV